MKVFYIASCSYKINVQPGFRFIMSGVFYEGESSEDSSSSDDSSYNESCSEESKEASAGDIEFSSENEDSDAMLEELSN